MSLYPRVAGLRFSKVGKIYHFDAGSIPELKSGDAVIVETSRGWQIGYVIQLLQDFEPQDDTTLKTIDRLATPRDLLIGKQWEAKTHDVINYSKKRARELNLAGVKVVDAEYSFDGSRLTIFFSTETEDKVDLKSLRQDLQKAYNPSQVELRQIGPRDVAKLMCGMGACGMEIRCCSRFLCEFSSISIRMAKEQDISLTPSEITGMCGRLRCCLIYEFETYSTARKKLPKKNKKVQTPAGEGKVINVQPLKGTVVVQLANDVHREFSCDEVKLIEEEKPAHNAPQAKNENNEDSAQQRE